MQPISKVGNYELTQHLESLYVLNRTYEVFKASKMTEGVRTQYVIYKYSRDKLKDMHLSDCLNNYIKELLQRIKNGNLMLVQPIYETLPTANSFYLVYRYFGDGSLESKTEADSIKMTDVELVPYLMQVLVSIRELHQIGVLHRKIKPSNIFLESPDDQGFYRLKIGDACWFPLKKSDFAAARHRDLHLAPEVLTSEGAARHDSSVYAWTIGYLAYYLLAGRKPNLPDYYEFANPHHYQINTYLRVTAANTGHQIDLRSRRLAQGYPDHLGDFIKKTLVFDPRARLNFSQIFNHPLFVDYVSRYPNGFSSNSRQAIEQFKQARDYYRSQQRFNSLEDFTIFPPVDHLTGTDAPVPTRQAEPIPFGRGSNEGTYISCR